MSNEQEMTDRIERAREGQRNALAALAAANDELRMAQLEEAEMFLDEERAACTCDVAAQRYDEGCGIADAWDRVERLGGSR